MNYGNRMNMNLSGWYKGRISLDGKVLDLLRKEVRPLTDESALKKYYNECVSKLENVSSYFGDKKSLEETIKEAQVGNIPHFKAMDPIYPSLFTSLYRNKKESNPILISNAKALYIAHYNYLITTEPPFDELYDFYKEKGIAGVPEEELINYPSIVIPNDRTRAETKESTYHEALHHVIYIYKMKSKHLLTNDGRNYATKTERLIAEIALEHKIIGHLTDRLLEDDKEALFEYRWAKRKYKYPLVTSINDALICSSIALAISSWVYPLFLLFIPLPLAGKYYISNKYKDSKRDEILGLTISEDFKI